MFVMVHQLFNTHGTTEKLVLEFWKVVEKKEVVMVSGCN